jgi:hypothetical protein
LAVSVNFTTARRSTHLQKPAGKKQIAPPSGREGAGLGKNRHIAEDGGDCRGGCSVRYVFRLAIAVGFALTGFLPAHAERRVALAVGIDVYQNLSALEQLQTAVNDARAVGAVLSELGFDTIVEENVARLAFTRAWQKFLNRLEPGDTAALFFAGHGVEIGGLNYLLPRDIPKVASGEDKLLALAALRFNDLMDDLRERKAGVSILIIDACRDNPFRDGAGRSAGGTRGLARIEPPRGSFVMYSAGAGEQALDHLPGGADTSPNSVYTRTLVPILKTPGLSLQDIAAGVREKVAAVTRTVGREQTPAYYDQVVGKLVLRPSAAAEAKPEPYLPLQKNEAAEAWAAVKDSASIAQLEVIVSRYRGTVYADLAEARIEELKKQKGLATPMPTYSRPALTPDASKTTADVGAKNWVFVPNARPTLVPAPTPGPPGCAAFQSRQSLTSEEFALYISSCKEPTPTDPLYVWWHKSDIRPTECAYAPWTATPACR